MAIEKTYCDRILAAILGKPNDELPFAPRLDVWYQANKKRGTLPAKFRNAELIDIIEELDIGYNATVPNYRDIKHRAEESGRGIGVYQCEDIFYKVRFDVDKKISFNGDETTTLYQTPFGDIQTKSLLTKEMESDGITLSHVSERAFKSPDDYQALMYIFEHSEVEPYYSMIEEKNEHIRNRGPCIAFTSSVASPMHYIQKHLMGYEQFFYEYNDHLENMLELASSIECLEEKIFNIAFEGPIDIVRIGANYDSMLHPPPFFRKHMLPNLASYAKRLHNRGKLLLTHTDGENQGLIEMYVESGIDIADAVCPAPMTKMSLNDIRSVFGNRITIWGGIPSNMLLKSACTDRDFENYLDSLFVSLGKGCSFIMAIADTTPPDASFDRIIALANWAKRFGRIPERGD